MAFFWKPYVPVAQRRAKAKKQMEKLRQKGQDIQPVAIDGHTIARSFWARAGAITWNHSPILRIACRADAHTCAKARSATWKSSPGALRRWFAAPNSTRSPSKSSRP